MCTVLINPITPAVDRLVVTERPVDPAQGGSFGLAVKCTRRGVTTFAAVDGELFALWARGKKWRQPKESPSVS